MENRQLCRFLIRFLCMWVILFNLTGCTSDILGSAMKALTSFETSPVWLQQVSFHVSDKVNDASPVTVNIVIPYEKDLYQNLSKMKAKEYFAKAQQIKLDNSGKIDIFEWELIRSQMLNDQSVKPSRYSGTGILVFANYTTPGDHRQTIADDEHVLIKLNDEDFQIESIKK